MPPGKQRGARLVYVAGAARELPDEVQEWLSHPGHPAVAASGVYEALAMLAGRRRPAAILVSMESVDWDELEFFEHAVRVGRDTRVYVVGGEHQQAKIEVAVNRGARRFDGELLDEDLRRASARPQRMATRDLLAGTLEAVQARSTAALRVAAGGRIGAEAPPLPPARGGWPAHPVPERQPEEPEDQEVARVEEPVLEPVPSDDEVRGETDRPVVRLVSRGEEEDELASEEEASSPIPFPWAPSPNRPKRTPPSARGESLEAANEVQPGGSRPEAATAFGSRQPFSPVELTAEELAALVGKPVPSRGVQGEPRT